MQASAHLLYVYDFCNFIIVYEWGPWLLEFRPRDPRRYPPDRERERERERERDRERERE